MPANACFGASGTPSLAVTRSVATSSMSCHSSAARPPRRRRSHSSVRRPPPAVSAPAGRDTAYPPRSTSFSSGRTCARLANFPTTERACRQGTRALPVSSACSSAIAARRSSRLPLGHRSLPSSRPTLIPKATTGSPTTILAGAACSPSSASPRIASCAHLLRRDYLVIEGHAGEVVNVHLHVPWRRVLCAWRQGALALPLRSALRPSGDRWGGRLGCVERRLLPPYPCRHQRGDAFKPVGGEGAPKTHAPVYHHACTAMGVPPHKTLSPPVCPLDRAEPVCRLRICHPCHRPRACLPGRRARTRFVDERQRARQLLHFRQHGGPLARRHACVDSVGAAIAGPGAPRAIVDHPLSRLEYDVARLEPARDEREVSRRLRDPLLIPIRLHRRRRRRRLSHQARVVEGEYGQQLTSRPDLHAPFTRLGDDVLVAPRQRLRRRAQCLAVELPGAREACRPCGALDRSAVRRVGAVPHDPPRPSRHFVLRDGDRGYLGDAHLSAAGPRAQRRHRRVRHLKPRLYLVSVDARQEQVRNPDGPVGSGRAIAALRRRGAHVPWQRRPRAPPTLPAGGPRRL
eukprot:6197449-Pleurochrysis_carterae.AAC.2